MTENIFGSIQSPDLLSPNLRVKAQKRRRTRLGTSDVELERSTQELLTALRDPAVCQSPALKPLPAISAAEKVPANGLFDSQELEEAVNDTMKQFDHSKRPGKARASRRKRLDDLERCPTFTKSSSVDAGAVKGGGKAREVPPGRNNENKFGDDASIFSDMSDELGFERRTRRRNSRRAKDNQATDESKTVDLLLDSKQQPDVLKASPRRRVSRRGRNSPAVVSPIEKLTLRDGCSPKITGKQRTLAFDATVDAQKGKPSPVSKHNKQQQIVAKQSKLWPISDDFELTKSNLHTHDSAVARKPRGRQGRLLGTETGLDRQTDRAASDVMSVVSSDVGDAYDPTFCGASRPEVTSRLMGGLCNPSLEKVKGHHLSRNLSTGREEGSGDDVSVDIFTSPKRHKKRSRRRHQAENLETGLLSTNQSSHTTGEKPKTKSELIFGAVGNDLSLKPTFNGEHNVSPRRRGYNKYLPPLSESLNHLK